METRKILLTNFYLHPKKKNDTFLINANAGVLSWRGFSIADDDEQGGTSWASNVMNMRMWVKGGQRGRSRSGSSAREPNCGGGGDLDCPLILILSIGRFNYN